MYGGRWQLLAFANRLRPRRASPFEGMQLMNWGFSGYRASMLADFRNNKNSRMGDQGVRDSGAQTSH